MRKYILPLLVCALAASACGLKDDFTAQNLTDLVTVQDNHVLMNDYGVPYYVTSDLTDGKYVVNDRLLILFDVTNRNYDITLKTYLKSTILKPVPVENDEPSDFKDPVIIQASSISGGYVNLQFSYYRKKDSSYEHRIFMEYKDDTRSNFLNLFLLHDGNGENPTNFSTDQLEEVYVLYSFPIYDLIPSGESRMIDLTLYELLNDNSVSKTTHRLYDQTVNF